MREPRRAVWKDLRPDHHAGPCPGSALPCPALPCPALPCPGLPACWVAPERKLYLAAPVPRSGSLRCCVEDRTVATDKSCLSSFAFPGIIGRFLPFAPHPTPFVFLLLGRAFRHKGGGRALKKYKERAAILLRAAPFPPAAPLHSSYRPPPPFPGTAWRSAA